MTILAKTLWALASLSLFAGAAIYLLQNDNPQLGMIGFWCLSIGAVAGILAVLVQVTGVRKRRPSVFTRPISKLIKQDHLPSRRIMRKEIADILEFQRPLVFDEERKELPASGVQFAMDHINQMMADWGLDTVQILTDEQGAHLYATWRIMMGDDAEVARMSKYFSRSAEGLALRAERIERDAAFSKLDAVRKAYISEIPDQEQPETIQSYHVEPDLVGFLSAMRRPDPDLWHDIASSVEPGWSRGDAAVYWIAAQAECDKSTIVTILARYAEQGTLSRVVAAELKENSTDCADQIEAMLNRWAVGFYTDQNFSTPTIPFKDALAAEIAKVAVLLERDAWPQPADLFTPFVGRQTSASYHFASSMELMNGSTVKSDDIRQLAKVM